MNLITGATGLVGAHVALQLLQEGKPVKAIKRSTSDIDKTKKLFSYYISGYENLFNKIQWVEADINDIYSLLDALDGVEAVYHCAGFVSYNDKDAGMMERINTFGTANVVNACLEKNIQSLCHVSSIATLQNPDITVGISESVFWKSSPNVSNYAISKYNGEREVWRGIEEGLNSVIVNPGIVIGPGFWNQSSGRLISTCFKGSFFYTKGSSAIIDARDVATCMIQLIEKKEFNKRFILIENNYSLKEVLSVLHNNFGRKAPQLKVGMLVLRIAKWLDALRCLLTGKDRLLTKDTINSCVGENSYSNANVKNVIAIDFIPFKESSQFVCQAYVNDIKK